MRSIKRIIKIHELDGYKIYCQFNNGESRVIDFEEVFRKWDIKEGDLEYKLTQSLDEFQKVDLEEGTFVWKNNVIYNYDLDPIVMYEMSEMDESRNIEIGMMIKRARKDLGLTQEELAKRSGTSKHYISKIENSKSGIELSTLTRIIEGGLGKRLEIKIV